MKNHPSSFRLALCALAVGCTLVTPPARAVEYGAFVGPATVDTRFLPVIVADPRSVTNLAGTPVTFTVNAAGMAPLVYQWRGNGTNLADGGRISGARTNSLSVTNVQGQDVGFYSAVVSNPWGSVTSAPALLRVLAVERLTLAVPNQSPARFDFTNAAWVEVALTAPFPNALIFYTLDGSVPSAASDFYSGPLIVSNAVVVRALAYNPVDFSSVEMAPAAVNLWTAFHLFVTTTSGGMVSNAPPGGFYVSNTVVTLTALPAAGWEFLNWTGDASGTSSNLSLVMNRDKSVTAQFGLIPRYTLAAATVGSGVVSGNTQSNYLRGTTVCLTATPAAGWEFLNWTGDASGTSSNLCLVMHTNKSVTAQFALIPRYTLTVATVGSGVVSGNTQSNYLRGTAVNLRAEPAAGWEFLSWSGDASGTASNLSLVMNTNKSVTAQFGRTLFTLTVTTVGGGAVSGNTQSNYFSGTTVNLRAEPQPGWYFQSWSGDAAGTSRNVSVLMNWDKSVAATFAPLTLLAVAAGGGTVTANSASNFVQDSAVTLTGQPHSGWTFLNWMGDASGTNPQASVTMDRPKEVQAVFGTTCNTSVLGLGTVVRNFGTGLVPFGGVVRLTAIPQPGYYLGLWGNAASSVVNPLDFTVTNANPTVGAFFLPLGANQATLTVLEQGAGVVAREPQANVYPKGQGVQLTAWPFPGQAFLGWSGDASGTQNPLTVTVTTNRTITATFTHRLGLAIHQWPGPTQPRGFRLLLAGDEGSTCLVQTSPDLADWQPLTTLTISNTAVQFIDVAVTNHSPRLYRAISQP
jgi:NOL1/NOP2/fmu family ribosome biogenesis protein